MSTSNLNPAVLGGGGIKNKESNQTQDLVNMKSSWRWTHFRKQHLGQKLIKKLAKVECENEGGEVI